jgi:RNA polymerase primary sigma factor
MAMVSEKVVDREEALSPEEESDLLDRETDHRDNNCGSKVGVSRREAEFADDSLNLYLAEVGKTSLLDAEETNVLVRRIEEGKYLDRLAQDWSAEHSSQPSAIDLLLALMDHFTRTDFLFANLCQYLGIPSESTIVDKVSNSDLRRAIDGTIEEHFSSAIAKVTGQTQAAIDKALIDLSLDSRLIPWDIMEEAGQKSLPAEFEDALQSFEFFEKLEAHHSEIAGHFEHIRERSRQAANHMIQANLRLVVSVAKGHTGWNVPLPDLIQEGNIGLMQAVQKFDHRRGTKFSTYAIPWIWQAINRAVNDQSRTVRLPGHLIDDLTKLSRAKNSLTQKFGRQPTYKELASETGLLPKKIQLLLELSSRGSVPYETPIGDDGGAQLGDFIPDQTILQPEEQSDESLLREELGRLLETLTPRERRVIELRFGLDNEYCRTLAEVGTELGLSKERIRQLEKEALAKLRHPSHSRELIGFLG